jgi:hypothetical protein
MTQKNGGRKEEMYETRISTLDTGSHINARHQGRLEAGAGAERMLLGVGCTPLIRIEIPSSAWHGALLG